MSTMTFDTLSFARRMESVGFTRQQAEAMAEEQAKLIDEKLTTKNDLELLKRDLTIRMGAIVGAGVAILSTLFTILLRFPQH